jgi:hypothetical protein
MQSNLLDFPKADIQIDRTHLSDAALPALESEPQIQRLSLHQSLDGLIPWEFLHRSAEDQTSNRANGKNAVFKGRMVTPLK